MLLSILHSRVMNTTHQEIGKNFKRILSQQLSRKVSSCSAYAKVFVDCLYVSYLQYINFRTDLHTSLVVRVALDKIYISTPPH
jgi:hypothetical protein